MLSSTRTSSKQKTGGRTVTIREIKPIDRPPPPPLPEPTAFEADPAFAESVVEYHETHPGNELLFMGATVYRSKDSPPRTLVRYWPQIGRESVSFWSSADFALIAGGIKPFADSAGETHHLIMGWGNVEIEQLSNLRATAGIEYEAPEIPEFPAGPATFKILGGTASTESLIRIQSLHDLFNNNLAELTTAYQGREQARLNREAYLKAHPPQPKDITLNFWRIGGGTPVKGSAQ